MSAEITTKYYFAFSPSFPNSWYLIWRAKEGSGTYFVSSINAWTQSSMAGIAAWESTGYVVSEPFCMLKWLICAECDQLSYTDYLCSKCRLDEDAAS